MLSSVARRFQLAAEPFATIGFWAPEMQEEYTAIGLDAVSGYFVARSAGMGRASPAAVAAAFFNFSPAVVEGFLRWDAAGPLDVSAAQARGAQRALARVLDGVDTSGLGRATELLRRAVEGARGDGRVLYQATRSLPWPQEPFAAAWFGATLLREYRGDGHIAVLVEHGISAPEAVVLHAGYMDWSDKARTWLLSSRSWPEEDYTTATKRLAERGFVLGDGTLTDAGEKFREMIEMETDRLATPPFEVLGLEASEELIGLLGPWSVAVVEGKGVPRGTSRITRAPAHPS